MNDTEIKACRCNKCGKTYDSVWEYQSCDFGGCRGTIMPASGDREPATTKTPEPSTLASATGCDAWNKICLCGSARFFKDFRRVELELTMAGNLVWTIIDITEWSAIPEEVKYMLNSAHIQKIDACDEVLVINRDGYIGKDTQREIEYAHAKGKKVSYHWPKQHNNRI